MDISNSQQRVDGTDTSAPSQPQWPSSPPDTLSLYGIARRYCRERILVDPLRWTNRQLELLQISFSEPSLAPPPGISKYTGKRAGLTLINDYYDKYHDYYRRVDCVRSLFEEERGPFAVAPWQSFAFPHDLITSVRCHALFYPYPVDWLNSYPVAAYIDRDFVEDLREKSVHLPKYSSSNLPMQAISRLQLKKIRPENPLKDPYIAALMIALAQNTWGHVEWERPELLPMLKTYPSYVLTSSESAECMHLFKAELPSSLLDMFEFPNVAPPPWAPITIQVFTIPFEPALTFRDRLSALIVPKNIDPSNDNPPNGDSFNRNPSDGNPSDGNKRKRTSDRKKKKERDEQ
ncbi:hypothetical protein H0G86_010799 [Trichoderma simmonsii]|uniref:Uncharacterized protein n=1 Tax=Trichoderma simmonsii TaxID=1491479 RepID=A0A8G0LK98_9HYPO|nr:hypothetical protein H0G86_010799 [Trichoderma simmonsii]